jgi:hypothetical protein
VSSSRWCGKLLKKIFAKYFDPVISSTNLILLTGLQETSSISEKEEREEDDYVTTVHPLLPKMMLTCPVIVNQCYVDNYTPHVFQVVFRTNCMGRKLRLVSSCSTTRIPNLKKFVLSVRHR